MSYGRYGMKNIGGATPNDMMGIAYSDPWFAAGALLAQNWNKNYDDRGQKKADAVVDTQINPTAEDLAAAQKQAGGGLLDIKVPEMIKDSKYQYEIAKLANDPAMLQASQKLAAQARQLGDSMGLDLTGYGANDSLESIYARESKKGGYSVDPKTENIGMGLYTQQKPIDTVPGKGLLTGAMEQFAPQKPKELPNDGKGLFESVLGKSYSTEPKGVFASFLEQGPPKPKTPMQMLEEMQAQDKQKITLADLSKTTGIDYEAQAQAIAKEKAKARMLDPNFVSNTEQKLREAGYTPGQIENAMGRVREQAKNAQTEDLSIRYLTDLRSGDMQKADSTLAKLALVSPETAQLFATRSPSNKDMWNVDVKREDAKIANDYVIGRMDRGHELSEDTANNNIVRQQTIANFTAQLQLKTQGMGMEQKYNFIYDKLIAAGAKPHEAAQAALGIKQNGSNNNQLSAQYKAAVDYIKQAEEYEKNNPGEKWEDQESLKVARQIQQAGFMPQQAQGGNGNSGSADTGGNGQINVYKQAMSFATDMLEQNMAQGNKLPKQTIINIIKSRAGDMAPNIVNNIDWAKWGYDQAPAQYGALGTD